MTVLFAASRTVDGDLVAFGLMLSGMAMAAGFVALIVLSLTHGGPVGAMIVTVRWVYRLGRKDPFPVTTTLYWLTTTASFPAWPAVRILVATLWGGLVACGIVGLGVDAVKGPKETRHFRGPDGRVIREVSRRKPKRVLPPKMSKAVKAAMPARDRIAHRMDVRYHARNEERASVGLEPLKQSWAHRQLVAKLPTGKIKEPTLKGKERTAARRDAVARVALDKADLPAPPMTVVAASGAAWRRRENRGYL